MSIIHETSCYSSQLSLPLRIYFAKTFSKSAYTCNIATALQVMKGISGIIAILCLCVIMTVKAAPVDNINTGSDKEMNITDIINPKVC